MGRKDKKHLILVFAPPFQPFIFSFIYFPGSFWMRLSDLAWCYFDILLTGDFSYGPYLKTTEDFYFRTEASFTTI